MKEKELAQLVEQPFYTRKVECSNHLFLIRLYCVLLYILLNGRGWRKVPFAGMMGWAVNSMAKAIKGSIPFLPISVLYLLVRNDILAVSVVI